MIKFLNKLFKTNKGNAVLNDMRSLKIDKPLFRGVFLKQNILAFTSCVFVLLFSSILKNIIISKNLNISSQLMLILFFSLSMVFLALTLFQLNIYLLQWWILIYIACPLIIFFDVLPLTNIYFYILLVFVYVYLYFTSTRYRKSDEIFLRFNWKTVFRSGFHHQFVSVIILLLAIVFFSFAKIDNQTMKDMNFDNFVKMGLDTWADFKPNSSLNKSFEDTVGDFVNNNTIIRNLQKQYSFLGLSSEKLITDNVQSMFKNGFDSKAKLSQILVDYFNKTSQGVKLLVFGIFLWFIFSLVGFFYFISRILIYYLSSLVMSILIWFKFFKFEEKPAVKKCLTM